ncbi:MAG: leucyl aminopeptidase [Porticoccaceae bacterium]|nr:leucyl aminopeptidase [Porticoccaceae bacterium]
MEFTASSANLLKIKADCLILMTNAQIGGALKAHNSELYGELKGLAKTVGFDGKSGSSKTLYTPGLPFPQIILIGVDGTTTRQKRIKAIADAATKAIASNAKKILWVADEISEDSNWQAAMVARNLLYASYKYVKNDKVQPSLLKTLVYWTPSRNVQRAAAAGLDFGAAVGAGMNCARELGNLPANICTPNYLADQARSMASDNSMLECSILNESDMQKLGMGSLLSVAAGTVEPAQFIVMDYRGGAKSEAPIVLIGKAVTFDSGGISLKPGGGMDEMKFDMCGGASVFGVMQALNSCQLSINVVGLVPAVENMPSGTATRPGDVVTSMSGQTIEVLNTDAEGRLILCDAITYSERFKPRAVIDIATLTGACVMALGKQASGLLSNDQALAEALLTSGTHSGDRAWQLPLWEEYDAQLKSNFADMANIGGREAGTITAACFLARYAKNLPWAHIDIAGTAWLSGAQKGATGRPVPLLMDYLQQSANRSV